MTSSGFYFTMLYLNQLTVLLENPHDWKANREFTNHDLRVEVHSPLTTVTSAVCLLLCRVCCRASLE